MYRLSMILIIAVKSFFCVDVLATKLKPLDNILYKKVFECIKNKKWQDAEHFAKKTDNKTLFKIVLSQEFLDENYKNNDFRKIVNFLKQNPQWHQNSLLRLRAESLIDNNFNKNEIYQWFSRYPPVTALGYKCYALAASEILIDTNQLAFILKDAWIYGAFNKDEQIAFYKKFRKFLGKNDTIKRIDNLIWKGASTLAKSLFYLVDPKYTEAFEAQIAFTNKNENAEKLFKKVLKEYYTPGLVYQYINSKKDDLPEINELIKLICSTKHYQFHENSLLRVQAYIARECIAKKRYEDAYKIASKNFATSAENIRDIEFLSGWIALRFLNKTDLAIKHFKKFNRVATTPISISRGLYWLARSYTKSGKKEKATHLYQKIAYQFGYTFYGQVATIELGETKLRLPTKITVNHNKNNTLIKSGENLKAANLVTQYSQESSLVKIYLESLIDLTKEEDVLVTALTAKTFQYYHKVWLSRRALQKHIFIENYSYPDPYRIKKLPTEKSLVYSIIRQESSFEKSVIASDSGMGLMQLMKPAACDTAKKLYIKCFLNKLTEDAHYNLTLGSHYLADMIRTYQGSYVLAITAYNAGPYRVKRWLSLHGDIKKFRNYHNVIDWIESIPFPATRNYVQRVLENLQIYRVILNKSNKLKLKQDLLVAQ